MVQEFGGTASQHAAGSPSIERIARAVAEALGRMEARPAWAALDAYLGDLAARNGPRHVATTTQQLRALREACPTPSVAEVFAWRSAALRGGKSKATVNHYTGRLQTYLRWAAAAGMPVESALLALAPLAVTARDLARRPRAFTEAEAEAFFDACLYLDRRTTGVPQVPAWRFLLSTGLRWSEAAALDGAHISGDVVVLPAASAKRGKGRKVGPLPGDLLEHFRARRGAEAILIGRHGKPWRDVGHRVSHRSFVTICARAGLQLVNAEGRLLTIHSFRRTYATRLLRAGVPIAHVSRLMGHSSTAFTERVYVDLTADDPVDAARRVLKRQKKEAVDEQPGLFDNLDE